ncbi:hypothetical protein BGW42_000360 [Actinomortierella wolfii]|nr:hypothetical protein BGW42_000360 [Actinomortierella wolfii]
MAETRLRRQTSLTPIKTKISRAHAKVYPTVSSISTISSPQTAVQSLHSVPPIPSPQGTSPSPLSTKSKPLSSIVRGGSVKKAVKAIEDSFSGICDKAEKSPQFPAGTNDHLLCSRSSSPPLSSTTLVAPTPISLKLDVPSLPLQESDTSPPSHECNQSVIKLELPNIDNSSALSIPGAPEALVDHLVEHHVQATDDVMKGHQQAVESVNGLDSKIHELEKTCEPIQTYEKERQNLTKNIQELQRVVRREEQWRLQTMETIHRVHHTLQQGLASISTVSDAGPIAPTEPHAVTAPSVESLDKPTEDVGKTILTALQYLGGIESADKTEGDINNDISPSKQVNRKDDKNESSINQWLRATAQAISDDEQKRQQTWLIARHQSFNTGADMGSTILTTKDLASTTAMAQSEVRKDRAQYSASISKNATLSSNATLTGSHESLATDLGCMLDERVYLKQHIQSLDGLLAQEKEKRIAVVQQYYRLFKGMEGLARAILEQVNLLTVSHAMISETVALVLSSNPAVAPSPLLPDPTQSLSPNIASGGNTGASSSNLSFMTTKKDLLLQEHSQMDQCLRKLRELAAECVQVVDQESEMSACDLRSSSTFRDDPIIRLEPQLESLTADAPPNSTLCQKSSVVQSPSPQSLTISNGSSLSTVTRSASAALVDGISFQEFRNHLVAIFNWNREQATAASIIVSQHTLSSKRTANAPTVPPLPWTAFMDRVLEEDIKPCLLMPVRLSPAAGTSRYFGGSSNSFSKGWSRFFGSSAQDPQYHYVLASTAKATIPHICELPRSDVSREKPFALSVSSLPPQVMTNLSSWQQQLLKAIERNACEIIYCKTNQTCRVQRKLSTFDKGTSPLSCAASAASASNDKSNDQKMPLDRFCRDRLVAVCDFFMFLAHLRQGLLNHYCIMDLYKRELLLRKRMACARMGAVDLLG